jgi:hypothetical protein
MMYVFSILRLPFAVIPYGIRLCVLWAAPANALPQSMPAHTVPQSTRIHAIRLSVALVGNVMSLVLTFYVISVPVNALGLDGAKSVLSLTLIGQMAYLVPFEWQVAYSGMWQSLPHRDFADHLARLNDTRLLRWLYCLLKRYCDYYSLSDEERAHFVVSVLKHSAQHDPGTSLRLAYLNSFRIVPTSHNLVRGHVRDIAHGEVYIHSS